MALDRSADTIAEVTQQRDRLAQLLDDLVQEVSMGTKTLSRQPTYETFAGQPFASRFERLESDSLAAERLLKTKNSRAKARAKQMSKRRGLSPMKKSGLT